MKTEEYVKELTGEMKERSFMEAIDYAFNDLPISYNDLSEEYKGLLRLMYHVGYKDGIFDGTEIVSLMTSECFSMISQELKSLGKQVRDTM